MTINLVIEIVDANSMQIAFDRLLTIDSLAILGDSLGIQLDAQTEIPQELSSGEVAAISRAFALKIPPLEHEQVALLREAAPIDELPYKVHTGRELSLMASGSKPLAVFSEYCEYESEVFISTERIFSRYVEAGQFVRFEEIICGDDGRAARFVFYSLPNERWRINSYLLMLRIAKKTGWSEGFERMQGALLGYKDHENDIYIQRIYEKSQANAGLRS